jgi:CheB methylesterase
VTLERKRIVKIVFHAGPPFLREPARKLSYPSECLTKYKFQEHGKFLLSSLAEQHGEALVGILLSGGGTDGTLGITATNLRRLRSRHTQADGLINNGVRRKSYCIPNWSWVVKAIATSPQYHPRKRVIPPILAVARLTRHRRKCIFRSGSTARPRKESLQHSQLRPEKRCHDPEPRG